jgi:hypothetical protein
MVNSKIYEVICSTSINKDARLDLLETGGGVGGMSLPEPLWATAPSLRAVCCRPRQKNCQREINHNERHPMPSCVEKSAPLPARSQTIPPALGRRFCSTAPAKKEPFTFPEPRRFSSPIKEPRPIRASKSLTAPVGLPPSTPAPRNKEHAAQETRRISFSTLSLSRSGSCVGSTPMDKEVWSAGEWP